MNTLNLKQMTALVIFDSVMNLGITVEENDGNPYFKRVRVYSDKGAALTAFAETPCTWSETVDFTTEEELNQKVATIEQKLLNGEYNDYM